MKQEKAEKSRGKRATVHARITESERRSLELLAGQERVNISDMLRALIVEGARRRGILPTHAENWREGIPQD